MADPKSPEQGQAKQKEGVGKRAKGVLKDEAVRAASWEARSVFRRIFGHNIDRIIRRLFR